MLDNMIFLNSEFCQKKLFLALVKTQLFYLIRVLKLEFLVSLSNSNQYLVCLIQDIEDKHFLSRRLETSEILTMLVDK